MRPYLDPRDHAFANGPVFTRPPSREAARAVFDRPEDGERLWEVFEAFERVGEAGEGLRLGLEARLVAPPGERRIKLGRDCVIRGIIRCEGDGRVEVGDLVYLGDGVIISARTKIEIGDGTLLAHGAQVFDNDTHPLDAAERQAHFRTILKLEPARAFDIPSRPVRIGRGCWIGFGAAVMKGVSLGDGAIVAAGAVATTDVPPNAIVAGNPARVVRRPGAFGLMSGLSRLVRRRRGPAA
jgi:acetyltransferase-like isoleucine patch superfamily enzyme